MIQTLSSTQINVNLKINTDNDAALMGLYFVICFVWCNVSHVKNELSLLASDFTDALKFAVKIFVIGFNSIVWGMGL